MTPELAHALAELIHALTIGGEVIFGIGVFLLFMGIFG